LVAIKFTACSARAWVRSIWAQDTNLGRRVALKLLPSEFTKDENRVRRFQQEARAASALNHSNILTIHEIGSENSTYFIATEYIYLH